jgi:fumarylacetoacetase
MLPQPDATHDPNLRSWVEGADRHAEFPIQNLPLGVFSPPGGAPRGGVAVGDFILDLGAVHESHLLHADAQAACALAVGPALNPLLAAGAAPRVSLRRAISALLAHGAEERPNLLHPAAECILHMPATVGDYTDLYAGIHHATNIGKLFRPDNPLLPNYKWIPIGYHGRASSVRPSGGVVVRPNGQRKAPDAPAPTFGPARSLDYELELGIWVGTGNELGTTIPIAEAAAHIAGYCLLNDWSARDIQAWEYQPLGPFLAKSFHTTISPWIVTPEALAPFRAPQPERPHGDPQPLPYLSDASDQAGGALALELEVLLLTRAMREAGAAPHRLSIGSALNLYWTPQQMLAHHASNGCNLRPGDLMGTGTISSPAADGYGSLMEITANGRTPVQLPNGETCRFLEDGDEVLLRAHARREGFVSIGFGACRSVVRDASF